MLDLAGPLLVKNGIAPAPTRDVAKKPNPLGLISYRTTKRVIQRRGSGKEIHFSWQRSSLSSIKVHSDQLWTTAELLMPSLHVTSTHPKPIRISVYMSIIADHTTSSIPHILIFRSENCIPIEAYIGSFFYSAWAVLPLLCGSEVSINV